VKQLAAIMSIFTRNKQINARKYYTLLKCHSSSTAVFEVFVFLFVMHNWPSERPTCYTDIHYIQP